ncbi:transporter substrate-binding domain-containing protein [Vibrio sp. S4M6]|uniref:substrate-binding periplasmic protein n=1 Tax=Vibrio sinus TaxID=2946865 RepID=UPI00202A3537|nr:transporter substrate-binding domain-containing protein [Vibrio sinus]MCL9783253.1 transporter substrate-binding domain-containing protein [Vibrio sinus]
MRALRIVIKLVVMAYLLLSPFSYALTFSGNIFPPFVQRGDDGEVSGPFVEMLKDVCKEMQEDCEFSLFPNKRLKHMVKHGKVDGGFVYGWNEDRASYLYYSIPFMLTEYGVFVPDSNKSTIQSLKDLQGYTVGVPGPKTNMAFTLNKIRNQMAEDKLTPIKVFEAKDENGELIRMLELERLDGYFSNKATAFSKAKKANATKFRYAWQYKEILYFAVFPKEYTNKATLVKFNQAALRVFSRKGYFQRKLSPWNISAPPLTKEVLEKYNIIYE